jgi:hypothetical protein
MVFNDIVRLGSYVDLDDFSAFRVLQKHIPCIFGGESRFILAPSWPDENVSLNGYGDCLAPVLAEVLRNGMAEGLDGAAVVLPARFGSSPQEIGRSLKCILSVLDSYLDYGTGCLLSDRLEHSDWAFEFADEALFIATFAPCYEENSPRYSFGTNKLIVLFQPIYSFRKHSSLIGEGSVVREVIRRKFREKGAQYEFKIPTEINRYVRPLKAGDPEVVWWK